MREGTTLKPWTWRWSCPDTHRGWMVFPCEYTRILVCSSSYEPYCPWPVTLAGASFLTTAPPVRSLHCFAFFCVRRTWYLFSPFFYPAASRSWYFLPRQFPITSSGARQKRAFPSFLWRVGGGVLVPYREPECWKTLPDLVSRNHQQYSPCSLTFLLLLMTLHIRTSFCCTISRLYGCIINVNCDLL